jgi:ubiquinone/menaquinone biosynthesis C-methylase UbiE
LEVGTLKYFNSRSAAQRYAQGRPYFHPQIVQRVQQRLSLAWPVPRAIDVACGTGLSTVALKPLVREIVGTDVSEEMIRLAPVDPQTRYVVAPAEDLPFPDAHFDLLTLCAAFHWLDATAFLREARRVLRVGGHMVIYDNAFTGRMEENPAFRSWLKHVYRKTYPTPPRTRAPLPQTAEKAGFRPLGEESYQSTVTFSSDGLVDYLLSQSNVIAAVEGGHQVIEQVRTWLTDRVGPFFQGDEERTFLFGGPIWYFVKAKGIQTYPATVHGAYLTGRRAAREVDRLGSRVKVCPDLSVLISQEIPAVHSHNDACGHNLLTGAGEVSGQAQPKTRSSSAAALDPTMRSL